MRKKRLAGLLAVAMSIFVSSTAFAEVSIFRAESELSVDGESATGDTTVVASTGAPFTVATQFRTDCQIREVQGDGSDPVAVIWCFHQTFLNRRAGAIETLLIVTDDGVQLPTILFNGTGRFAGRWGRCYPDIGGDSILTTCYWQ